MSNAYDLDKKAIEAKREYYRKWRQNNKDKIKKHQQNYWRKQAEKINQGS